MVKILFFARLKEALGTAGEELTLTEGITDLTSLRAALERRGGVWAHELSSLRNIRAAVNQEMASGDTKIEDGDEVAFFPPVTGG